MVEVLEINGYITTPVYGLLDIARKARNKWAHEMKEPTDKEVWTCIDAAQKILVKCKGINIQLQTAVRKGVPQWPIWYYSKEIDYDL